MAQHNHTSHEAMLRNCFFALSKKYSSTGSDAIWDAIEDGVEVWLKYPEAERTNPLLYTISYNILYHHTRDPKKKKTGSIDAMHEKGADLLSNDEWEEKYFSAETVSRILHELPAHERELILMRNDEIPFDEIARLTGEKKNTLEKRHGRIILKLRKILLDDMELKESKPTSKSTIDNRQSTIDNRRRPPKTKRNE